MKIYFLTANFMKSKYRSSIPKEKLASKLRDSVSVKNTPDFKDLVLEKHVGNSLAVQWLGLGAFTAVGPGSIPGWGTKIPQALGQKTKKHKTEAIL